MFEGEGGVGLRTPEFVRSIWSNNHEIKIAILLRFFIAELYLELMDKKSIMCQSKINTDKEFFAGIIDILKDLYIMLNKSMETNSSFKFRELKFYNANTGYNEEPQLKSFGERFKELFNGIDDNDIVETFIKLCKFVRRPTLYSFKKSYFLYMYKFLNDKSEEKNKITKDKVKEVLKALLDNENTMFDNYQLNDENQFTLDIAGLCGVKLDLLELIEERKNKETAITGGKKSKKLPKKEILGKTKSIHKISGDRKEYVKHKGKLITIKDYKELMKKKK